MHIRHANREDLPRLLEIYAIARRFMAENGNPNQWKTHKPAPERVERDIEEKINYVGVDDDGIVRFVFVFFTDPEPTYSYIENGAWLDDVIQPCTVFDVGIGRFGVCKKDKHKTDNAVIIHSDIVYFFFNISFHPLGSRLVSLPLIRVSVFCHKTAGNCINFKKTGQVFPVCMANVHKFPSVFLFHYTIKIRFVNLDNKS